MARITVEDCIDKIPNRFELIMLSSARAREISKGVKTRVERERDKNPVIALREIAEQCVDPEELRETVIKNLQPPPVYVPEDMTASTPPASDGADVADIAFALDSDEETPVFDTMTEQDMERGYSEQSEDGEA